MIPSYKLLGLPRIVFGQLVGFLTGHSFLKRHQALLDATAADLERRKALLTLELNGDNGVEEGDEDEPDKWCDLCNGGEQTTEHIMSWCDSLAQTRLEVFGEMNPQRPYQLPVHSLVLFLKEVKLRQLEMYETLDEFLDKNRSHYSSDMDEDNQC